MGLMAAVGPLGPTRLSSLTLDMKSEDAGEKTTC